MNALIRLTVLIACLSCVIGGHPGYFGYQPPLQNGYFPTFYQPLQPPQPNIRYHSPPQPIIRYQAPAALPQHFYSPPPSNDYRGFAYHTETQHGGRSQVVFVTGPESQQLMQQSIAAFRHLGPALITAPTTAALKPSSDVNSVTKTVPATVSQPIATQPIINPNINSKATVKAQDINSQPFYNSLPIFNPQPINYAYPASSPVASVYNVQVFPTPGHPSPFIRVPFPHHPFISSFYRQQLQQPLLQPQLNDTTAETSTETKVTSSEGDVNAEEIATGTEENVGEADENVRAEELSNAEENESAVVQNNFGVDQEKVGKADENIEEAEENVGEAGESVSNAEESVGKADEIVDAEENVGEENGGDPQESKVNQVDTAVPSLFLRLGGDDTSLTTTESVPSTSVPETNSIDSASSTAASATEVSLQVTEALEVTTPMESISDPSDVSEETNNANNENATSTEEDKYQTTAATQ